MSGVMKGIRILEVAQYTFVPAAGAVLADWGADVIKIEHPVQGDSQRGLLRVDGKENTANINFLMEHSNRGKRSLGLDISSDAGRTLLYEIAKESDVFLTNFLPEARAKLKIDVADLRAVNPKIIYARGTAHGDKGPERKKGGFDATDYWARSGSGMGSRGPSEMPAMQPGPGYGDSIGGMTIAGGIAAALFNRERTGEPSVVDISLLSTGMWAMGAGLAGSMLAEQTGGSSPIAGASFINPLVGIYRAKGGGTLMFTMLQGHRYWADTVQHMGRPELADDPRFATPEAFDENSDAGRAIIQEIIETATLEEWRDRIGPMKGQWGAFQTLTQIPSDPQVIANEQIREVEVGDGSTFRLVANPVQFDGVSPDLRKGPEHAQHTEEILLEMGIEWDRIAKLKESGTIN